MIREEVIEYFLNNIITVQDCAIIYHCDRKTLAKELKKRNISTKKFSLEKFIRVSNIIHKYKYDYSLTKEFCKVTDKVEIICPTHGVFKQDVYSHKRGINCPSCGTEKTRESKINTTDEFIEKAVKKHGNRYCYNKSIIVSNRTKTTITCLIHGDFQQTPDDHKSGKGCLACAREDIGWTKEKWKKKGNNRLATVYILKCWNEQEEFIKIGRTFNSIKKRFASRNEMPYNFEIIKIYESRDYDLIWEMEVNFHRKLKLFKFIPTIYFGGWTECFTISSLSVITDPN